MKVKSAANREFTSFVESAESPAKSRVKRKVNNKVKSEDKESSEN